MHSVIYADEPVDIWRIEKKNKNSTTNSNIERENDFSKSVVIQDNLITNIEEGEIVNKRKIIGLYDPEENGFALEMWNNTDPKKIFELAKKINNMPLSADAKKIYTKLLLTNSYSPIDEIDEKVFSDIKSDWLIRFKDINLIKEYLKKNINIDSNEKLIKFVLDELFSINENRQACEFLEKINTNFDDSYLTKFSVYCLIYLKKS